MRHNIFCKKIKTVATFAICAFLIIPSFLNLFVHTLPSFAADTDGVWIITLDGKNNAINKQKAASSTLDNKYTIKCFDIGTPDKEIDCSKENKETIKIYDSNDNFIMGKDKDNEESYIVVVVNNGEVVYYEPGNKAKLQNQQSISLSDSKTGSDGSITVTRTYKTVEGGTTKTMLQTVTYGPESYFDDILDYLASGSRTTLAESAVPSYGNANDITPAQQQSTEAETTTTCHGTAGFFGWVLCPILEGAAGAAVWAYENVIVPFLQTSPELLKTTGERNGTYKAWSIFRDIANVTFAILILFVVFSQITGIGIDNYGIKKTLPKLIVAAILINISFYICQGLVDISNVLGSGVYGLLNGVAEGITVKVSSQSGSLAGSITINILGIIGGAALTIFLVGREALWTMIGRALLAVVPVIIGAIVALLMLFLLLSIRQAIIVMLVALSPIAFVCYALPNTKKLFDRWAQILRGMLLLYPSAALLMAGGRLASRIVFASGAAENGNIIENLGLLVAAMAAEICPLFFIPSLTRNAFNATGQLGAALNRMSTRAVTGTRRAVRGSQRYQRTNDRLQNYRAQQRLAGGGIFAGGGLNGRRVKRYEDAARAVKEYEDYRKAHKAWEAGGKVGDEPVAPAMPTERQIRIARSASQRDRIAALKKDAASRASAVGENEAWAQADSKNLIEGSQNKAVINAGQQLVSTADYANATFANAVIQEAKTQHDHSVKQQNMWSRGDYVESRKAQNEAAISNELTRMYSDKYSRMDAESLQTEFENILKSPAGTENRAEQFQAAFGALAQTGRLNEARNLMDANSSGLASFYGDDKTRAKVAQTLGSSGDFILQEYAKHLGKTGASSESFTNWANSTDTGKDKSLAASLKEKGIDRLDKDALEFLSKHDGALTGVDAANIAKVASTTTDQAAIDKLAGVIEKLAATDPSKHAQIIKSTSADKAANMSQVIRDALAGIKSTDSDPVRYAKNQVWRDQIGDAIRDNPQIASRFTAEQQRQYINYEDFSGSGGI